MISYNLKKDVHITIFPLLNKKNVIVKFSNIFKLADENFYCIFPDCHSHSFKTDDVCTILPTLTFHSKFRQYFLKSHLHSRHLISYSKFETLYQKSTIIWGQCQPAQCSRALHCTASVTSGSGV